MGQLLGTLYTIVYKETWEVLVLPTKSKSRDDLQETTNRVIPVYKVICA
jgi:hypothetical protein